jgi:hypothetical protein
MLPLYADFWYAYLPLFLRYFLIFLISAEFN